MFKLSLALLAVCLAVTAFADPLVSTPYGQVSGTVDQGVYAFRGIPFAAPPIGPLRFAKAQKVAPWSGIINGSNFASGCIAECLKTAFPVPPIMCTPTTSEDCLYLNVYTPSLTGNLPVLVFFHGGNYIGGSGGVPLYDGADLARNQNIVVVTTNYRLGVLGSLFTGTAKGNFHVTDQRQSLIFVRDVIASFGGNPDQVTISGQSAGAFSVATHLASPKSWPYFHGAVILSDPFSLLAETPERAVTVGSKLLEALGCASTGGELEMECLRSVSVEQIMEQQVNHSLNFNPLEQGFLSVMMPWVPVVDGDELPYGPLYALTHNKFHNVPILFGTVANESVEFIYDIATKPLSNMEGWLLLDVALGTNASAGARAIYGNGPETGDVRPFVSLVATDYIFYCVNRQVGNALAQSVDTYMHYFDRLPSYSPQVYGATMPYCVDAICHADDLPFYFNPFKAPMPSDFTPPTPQPVEIELAHLMQTALANFVRNGNPNPLPNNLVFPKFTNSNDNFLFNYSTPSGAISGFRNQYCDFWDTVGYNHF